MAGAYCTRSTKIYSLSDNSIEENIAFGIEKTEIDHERVWQKSFKRSSKFQS